MTPTSDEGSDNVTLIQHKAKMAAKSVCVETHRELEMMADICKTTAPHTMQDST